MKKFIGRVGLITVGFAMGMIFTICDLTWAATNNPTGFDELVVAMKA